MYGATVKKDENNFLFLFWRWQVRASSHNSNNQPDATVLQVYYLTFCVARNVSGAWTPIIRSLQLY
jgi:hypothetical protein